MHWSTRQDVRDTNCEKPCSNTYSLFLSSLCWRPRRRRPRRQRFQPSLNFAGAMPPIWWNRDGIRCSTEKTLAAGTGACARTNLSTAGIAHPAASSMFHSSGLQPKALFGTPATLRTLSQSRKLATGMLNGQNGRTKDLITDENFGDVQLYIEFMVARRSNSGVYLQGHYEVQIFDSFGVATPAYGDAGGIYEGFSKFEKIRNDKFAGSPPRVNAARRPGRVAVIPDLVPGAPFRRERFQNGERAVSPCMAQRGTRAETG